MLITGCKTQLQIHVATWQQWLFSVCKIYQIWFEQ